MDGGIMNGGLNASIAQPIDNLLSIGCRWKYRGHQMMSRWPPICEWQHHRWAMLRHELAIGERQTRPDVIPSRQPFQLSETNRSSQLVHAVVEPEARHVVVRTATVE